MSLFQCENCGCVENTALSCRGFSGYSERFFDWSYSPELKGKLLCSACGPSKYVTGEDTEYGKWHNQFKRMFLPLGKLKTNSEGNLEHIETGDTDYHKYELPAPEIHK